MRILFDLTRTQALSSIIHHGGGKYGIAVFKRLVQLRPQAIATYYDDSLELDAEVSDLLVKKSIVVYKKSELDIVQAIRNAGNIVYSPLYREEYSMDSNILAIVTIHGLRQLEMPFDKFEKCFPNIAKQEHPLLRKVKNRVKSISIIKNYKYRKCLNHYKHIFRQRNLHFVTVSNHSKYSILSFMPFLSGKDIKVFYSPSTTDDSIDLSNYKNPYGKYWLLVSGNRWVKNCVRAIKAFDQLFGEHPLLKGKVVILGIRKTSDIVVKINNPNRFIFLGYSNEHALNGLYSNAYALIYPSLNEGFGYPPLEAMHKGCPVIASAVASIPEICGNAVLYFNPYSIPEMKMRILQMEDDSIRPQCIRLGKERQMMIEKKQKEDLDSLCQYILSFLQEDKVF